VPVRWPTIAMAVDRGTPARSRLRTAVPWKSPPRLREALQQPPPFRRVEDGADEAVGPALDRVGRRPLGLQHGTATPGAGRRRRPDAAAPRAERIRRLRVAAGRAPGRVRGLGQVDRRHQPKRGRSVRTSSSSSSYTISLSSPGPATRMGFPSTASCGRASRPRRSPRRSRAEATGREAMMAHRNWTR